MPGAVRTPTCQAPPWVTSASLSAPKPGQGGLDGGEALDVLGVGRGDAEGGEPADVLASEVHGAEVEMGDQLDQVGRRG